MDSLPTSGPRGPRKLDYNSILPAFREAIGVHHALFLLGFSPKETFVHVDPENYFVVVILNKDGCFAAETGKLEGTKEEIYAQWFEIATAVATDEIPYEDVLRMYTECSAFKRSAEFVTSILSKGISIPKTLN